jgi:hypothetical protein
MPGRPCTCGVRRETVNPDMPFTAVSRHALPRDHWGCRKRHPFFGELGELGSFPRVLPRGVPNRQF